MERVEVGKVGIGSLLNFVFGANDSDGFRSWQANLAKAKIIAISTRVPTARGQSGLWYGCKNHLQPRFAFFWSHRSGAVTSIVPSCSGVLREADKMLHPCLCDTT